MSWSDHIVPAPEAGTRPVLGRTRQAVQDIFALLGNGTPADEVCRGFKISPSELHACFEFASELVANRLMQRAEPGEARVHVSDRQLQKAFRRHVEAGRSGESESHLLLLIYAVECGLKKLLLERRSVKTTSKLDRDDMTHDLDDLLKLLGQSPRFHGVVMESPPGNTPPQRIHEALRYGRPLSPQSRKRVLEAVNEVIGYIEENFQ